MKSLSSEVNPPLPVSCLLLSALPGALSVASEGNLAGRQELPGCTAQARSALSRGPARLGPFGAAQPDEARCATASTGARTAQAPRLLSGCCPARQASGPCLLPGTRAARHHPMCGAGVSQGLIPAAPKIAVTSTHLERRPVAFWQAEAEIFTRLLLSINCWALQIKAGSVHRGFAGGLSLASTRGV